LRRFAAETKKNFAGITAQTEARLVAYAWPGNVRELANVIERAAIDAARATVIRRALAHTHGNRAAAARTLGLHKTHLLNLMKTLGIE
jgi:DNA-binding NtrC family response regulator